MLPHRTRGHCRLGAALLAGLCATGVLSTEPDSFHILKKLVADEARETALGQAQLYLEQYPQGEHRDLVTAWLGEILAERGEAEAALALLATPLPKLSPKERAKVNLTLGRAHLDLRQPQKAKTLLAAPGPLDKADQRRLRQLLGWAAHDLGQFDEAVNILRGISPSDRTTEDDLRLTHALVNSGDDRGGNAGAQSLLRQGNLKPEEEAEVRLLLAGCAYRLGDFAAVAPAVEPLIQSEEWRTEAMLLQAWALHRLGQEAEAYDFVRKAAPLGGWEEGALLAPLRSARLALDLPALKSASRRFLEAYPHSAWAHEAHLGLALCAESLGDAPSALSALEQALPHMAAGPSGFHTALAAARLSAEALRDWPRAKRHFNHAVEIAPERASRAKALLVMARAGRSLGATTEALSALARLVKEFPDTPSIPGAYLMLGELRCTDGHRAQGEEAFEVVVESFPDAPEFPSALLALSESLRAQGKTGEALDHLSALAGLPLPAAIASRRDRLLAELSLASGDVAATEAALLQLFEAPTDSSASETPRFQMGLLSLAQGNTDSAAASFGALRDRYLATAGRFRLALALFQKGQSAEGADLLQGLCASQGGGEDGGDDSLVALWALSEAWAAAGNPAESSDALRLLAQSGSTDPLVALAQRKVEMNLLAKEGPAAALLAIPAFREAEPISPALVADLLKKARLALKSGASDKSDHAYRTYLEMAPQGPGAGEASLALARSSARKGEWREVRALLSHAPESASRDALLGAACYALRDMPAAQAAYERALATVGAEALASQESLDARYFAGMASAVQGDREGTAAHWSVYATEAPATPAGRERLFQVALWLQRQQKLEPALAGLERLKAAWRDAAVGFQYGYTLELMGRSEEALAAFLSVARTSSNPQWAVTARYRAAELMVRLDRRDDAIALYRDLATATEGSVQGDFTRERLRALEISETPTLPPPLFHEEAPDAPSPHSS